jgi:hypothetical protein
MWEMERVGRGIEMPGGGGLERPRPMFGCSDTEEEEEEKKKTVTFI